MIISFSGKKNSSKDLAGKIAKIILTFPHFTNDAVEDFLNKNFKSI